MAEAGACPYSNLRPSGDRWPDCEAENVDGDRVAIEVTELVDADALRGSAGAQPWSSERVIEGIQQRIAKKDEKAFHGQRYAEVVLVIHTDEFYLIPSSLNQLLADHQFSLPYGNLTRVFLLFGYSPTIGRCPYFKLRLAA